MPAAEVVDLADELFAAIERGDEARIDELFADDIAVWRAGARRDDDKVRALKVLHWFIDVTTQRRYEDPRSPAVPGRFRPAAHPARRRSQRRIDRPAGVHRD
jgi:hypothetical protein